MVVISMNNIHPDVLKRYAAGKANAQECQLVEDWLENGDTFSGITAQDDSSVEKDAALPVNQHTSLSNDTQAGSANNQHTGLSQAPLTGSLKEQNVSQLSDHHLNLSIKQEIWNGLIAKTTKKQNVYKLKRNLFAIAAAVLCITAGAYLFNQKTFNSTAAQQITQQLYQVPKGKMVNLTLNDGTNVQLSGGSSFRYPRSFPGQTREVTLLSGEAFFKVKHNQQQPFIVHTAGTQIKVLGTRFNILNNLNSNELSVTLTAGSISFKGNNQTEKILRPGQKLTFDKTLNTIPKIEETDTSYVTSWTTGVLWFKHSPIAEALEKLEAYYGVTFSIQGNPDLNIPLTGKFQRQPLSRILRLIENSSDLKFKQEQNQIIIYKAN